MRKKSHKKQAIDNFFPSGRPLNQSDMRRRRQQFPDVGMTMSSYRGSFSDGRAAPSPAPAATFTKPKRLGKVKTKKKWSKKRKIITVTLTILALLFLWVGFKFGWNLARIFGNPFSIFWSTQLKGEDQGRVNILLAGNSADDVGHNGATLTDSIMIFSLDTKNNRAFLLSVPRDLYVDIPGYGYSKINAAYTIGQRRHFDEPGYANGGMGLLQKTIKQSLGVETYYYALVNYSALRDAVNAVGGITVNIQSSSPYGLYDPSTDWTTGGPLVDLSNGKHHLNGQEALNLARARGDAPGAYGYAMSDFTRTKYQRQILLSLKDKIFSAGVLTNPAKLAELFDSLGSNVNTDMNLGEARRLYDLMGEVKNRNFKSYALNEMNGVNYLSSYRTTDGQSALIPAAGLGNFREIQAAIDRLMSSSKVSLENANVVVLNGTDISGLADKNREILEQNLVSVTAVGNAKQPSKSTRIINLHGEANPATLAYLKRVYGQQVSAKSPYDSAYTKADFIIVLGSDRIARAN